MRTFIFVLAAIMAISLCGCKSASCITEVPVYVHDTLISAQLRVDSVYIDRWHAEYVNGDTVRVRDSVYVERYALHTDTVYAVVEKPVVVEKVSYVERKLTRLQIVLMLIGGLCTVIAIIYVLYPVFSRLRIRK